MDSPSLPRHSFKLGALPPPTSSRTGLCSQCLVQRETCSRAKCWRRNKKAYGACRVVFFANTLISSVPRITTKRTDGVVGHRLLFSVFFFLAKISCAYKSHVKMSSSHLLQVLHRPPRCFFLDILLQVCRKFAIYFRKIWQIFRVSPQFPLNFCWEMIKPAFWPFYPIPKFFSIYFAIFGFFTQRLYISRISMFGKLQLQNQIYKMHVLCAFLKKCE